ASPYPLSWRLRGQPRTPPLRPRCQNWLEGLPGAVTLRGSLHPCPAALFAGNPAPCRAAHAAKIGLAGFPAPPSLRATPRPAPLLTLHFLFIGPSGPTGISHFAGNPAPRRANPKTKQL